MIRQSFILRLYIKLYRKTLRLIMKSKSQFLAILLIQTFIFDSRVSSIATERKSEKVCRNKDCKEAAAELKRCMNTSADPCQDFYEFACGKYVRDTVIPEDKKGASVREEVAEKLIAKLKNLFEGSECDKCPTYEKKLKDYYRSCMDINAIEQAGVKPMQTLLETFGGWPLVKESWNDNQLQLTDIVIRLLQHRLMSLFNVIVYNDDKNSSIHTIILRQQKLTFPKDYYSDNKRKNVTDAYKRLMLNTGLHLLKDVNKEQLKEGADDILSFEGNLSKIVLSPDHMRRQSQEKISLKDLANKFDREIIDLERIVKELFKSAKIDIYDEEKVAVLGLSYFDDLSKLLKKTHKRTVVNYMMWRMIHGLMLTFPKIFQSDLAKFSKVAHGVSKLEPRWKRCVTMISSEMYKAVGALYAKKYFDKKAKEKVLDLIKELKETFKNVIHEVPWLLNETKSKALEKLLKMDDRIAYPDYYDQDTDLFKDMFDKLDLNSSGNFLEKRLAFASLEVNDNLKLLREPLDPDKPDMKVAMVSAFYTPLKNAISFPAGILQSPYFSNSTPMYLNFGGVGCVIGHEITHGFDDQGRKYDKDGNFLNWWQEEDENQFIEASECIVNQYNHFVVEGINEKVKGNLTLGENIADVGGFKASFVAYKNWTKKRGEEAKLDDLPYTPEQLFFINIGRIFCRKMRPQFEAVSIRTDYHAPNQYRVKGPLMNMKEFSEAFNCGSEAPMNPSKKCKVW